MEKEQSSILKAYPLLGSSNCHTVARVHLIQTRLLVHFIFYTNLQLNQQLCMHNTTSTFPPTASHNIKQVQVENQSVSLRIHLIVALSYIRKKEKHIHKFVSKRNQIHYSYSQGQKTFYM